MKKIMFTEVRATLLTRVQVLLAVLAGAGHALSVASPLSFQTISNFTSASDSRSPVWWLQWVSLFVLATLLLAVQSRNSSSSRYQSWKSSALLGWIFSTSWLAGTFWWTFIALHTYGGLPAVLAVAAVVSLAALLGLYYAAVCGVFVLIAPRSRMFGGIVFAALWLFAELARGVWFTGFGWGASGYAHVDGPLSAYAPWVGAYGLCFIAAWLAMTLAQALSASSSWRATAVHCLLIACVLVLPIGLDLGRRDVTAPTGQLTVTLLQGNIPQDEKFEPGSGVPLALQWYAEQLLKSQTDLVVAPETAIPLLPQQLPPNYWEGLRGRFSRGEQAALIGMPMGDYAAGYTNSLIGLKPGQQQPWRYDKHHLVPFGEFIPPFFKWFTELMQIPLGDFRRGSLQQAPFEWRGQRLAANICYEDLFGEELGQQFVDPLSAPTMFVNVSNLAWFGNSLAMDQHLQIARLRALEFERPFLLATNTGVTAIVDYRGRIVASLPRNTRGVLEGQVEGRSGITPFAAWISRFGLWPYWLLAMGVVMLAALTALRKR